MPQGRHKVPFSGKAKKVQMQAKRDKTQSRKTDDDPSKAAGGGDTPATGLTEVPFSQDEIKVVAGEDKAAALMDVLPDASGGGNRRGGPRGQQSLAERYQLRFKQESKAELMAKKEKARQPLNRIKSDSDLELDVDKCFPDTCDFPLRPHWTSDLGKAKIDANEAKYFRNYVDDLMEAHQGQDMSYFELNLETWRQLWRVLEKSDILLLVVDARYPAAMFPPSLYNHVVKQCNKSLVLVLNKVDLIPASLALAWKDYFTTKFPQLEVVYFSSCPTYNLCVGLLNQPGLKFRRLKGRISMVTEGAKQIYQACHRILNDKGVAAVDLESWRKKIDGDEEAKVATSQGQLQGDEDKKAQLTLGMIGQPNAGKSSLINSLMGKRVVSVSKTPGHTKHFQTIFITKSVVLCDCPGLVFPSLVERPLQVLLGSFPIAQVREPFSVVQFLAEKIDLVRLLKLVPQKDLDEGDVKLKKMSAFDVCELWAENRGYMTARSNRPDVNRSANHLLRMALDGKVTLAYLPPGYVSQNLVQKYESHPDLAQISDLLGLTSDPEEEERANHVMDDDFDSPDEQEAEDNDVEDDEEGQGEPTRLPISANKFSLLDQSDDDDDN